MTILESRPEASWAAGHDAPASRFVFGDEWRADALCAGTDPERFFPEGKPSNEAKRFCDACPVRQECLEFALASPWEPWGIAAGMGRSELLPEWRRRHPRWRVNEVHELLGLP